MKIEGSYEFNAPRPLVWEMLLDPDVLAKSMPGCQALEKVGEDRYKGVISIKVGPVQGVFQAVRASEFFTGLFTTALGEDEILTAVEVPVEKAGTCTMASAAIGGLCPWTIKVPSVEAVLVGSTLTPDVIASAAAAVADDLGDDILSDIHASVAYRRQMAPVFVGQAVTQAAERAA